MKVPSEAVLKSISFSILAPLSLWACGDTPPNRQPTLVPTLIAEPAGIGSGLKRLPEAVILERPVTAYSDVSIALAPSATPEPLPASTRTAIPSPTAEPLVSSQSGRAGEMQVTLTVSPGRAGINEINLYFFDAEGTWLTVDKVELRLKYLDHGDTTIAKVVPPLHPGHAFITSDAVRHAGRWQIEVAFQARRSSRRTYGFRGTDSLVQRDGS